MSRTTAAQKSERAEAIERLREVLAPGTTVYTVLRHRAASGMSRSISVLVLGQDERGEATVRQWDHLVSRALGYKLDQNREGIKVGGGGMDMGFHLVNSLSAALFPDGFACLGDDARCPSNSHANGERDYTIGHWHAGGAGAYALRHRWI
jgi:hypothetical protein